MTFIRVHDCATGEIRLEPVDDGWVAERDRAMAASAEAAAEMVAGMMDNVASQFLEGLLEDIRQAQVDNLDVKTIADLRSIVAEMLQREWDRTEILRQIATRMGM